MRSAKELCSMLITRSLKDLNEDEEDIVIDYLEDIGIEVNLDMKPRDMCVALLEKTMKKDLGKQVPLTAYANNVLGKSKSESDEKLKIKEKQFIESKRIKDRKILEDKSKTLPGCIVSDKDILSKQLYDLKVDPTLGIVKLEDGTSQYTASVSLSDDLYNKIFLSHENPILEINTSKGYKAYSRIVEAHSGSSNLVLISPLVAAILDIKNIDGGFLRLCMYLPEISKVGFTFYGNKQELEDVLPLLINKLPSVINAFSYLSLSMVLNTNINGKNVEVRVDKLEDQDETPIFAGTIPFGEKDLPFEIQPDII